MKTISSLGLSLLALVACAPATGSESEAIARKPLARSEVKINDDARVVSTVERYAKEHRFAFFNQRLEDNAYLLHLYREDVLVIVGKPLPSSLVRITVLPLCACEEASRPDLKSVADQVAKGISMELR